MMRRDREYGIDPRTVHKTSSFRLPIQKYSVGEHKGLYKIPSGSTIFTCFTSDFFHATADEWRDEAWAMIRERSDCNFFMVTKRPERIKDHLPEDWEETRYNNVQVSCTCENQYWTDRRLPIFLSLPLPHKSITHEPMQDRINIRKYLKEYGSEIESVSCGGESGLGSTGLRFCVDPGYAHAVRRLWDSLLLPPDRIEAQERRKNIRNSPGASAQAGSQGTSGFRRGASSRLG